MGNMLPVSKLSWLISSKRFSFQVKYTGYRDRSHEERIVRFQTEARDGSAIIVSPMDTLLYSLWSSTFFRTTSSCTYVTHHKSQWFLPTPFFFYLSSVFRFIGNQFKPAFCQRRRRSSDKGISWFRQRTRKGWCWKNSRNFLGLSVMKQQCKGRRVWFGTKSGSMWRNLNIFVNIGNNVSVIVFIST